MESDDNLRQRVLQSTLDEVAARNEEAAECCVICLDVITEPCEASPCGHDNFDYLCVANWLFETPRCPLCKAVVSSVIHGPPDGRITTAFGEVRAQPSPSSSRLPSSQAGRRARPPCGRRSRQPQQRPYGSESSTPITVRRNVYRNLSYSKHVGSNRVSRYRELTPRLFCEDAELVSRARMFIRRELQVFSFLTLEEAEDTAPPPGATNARTALERRRANNAEFLLEYVVAILKSVDIMGSGGQAEDMLTEFLGRENTQLFLHELRAWLRSPYSKLSDWDRAVQYDDAAQARAQPVVEERATPEPRPESESDPHQRSDRYAGDGYRDRHRRKGDFYRPAPRSRERAAHSGGRVTKSRRAA